MTEKYDVIVLGGGPAGFTAANRAAEAGLKTAIFEEDKLGGTCLNQGCIPSKSFIHSAKLFSEINEKSDESTNKGQCPDIQKWTEIKNKTVESLRMGVRGSLRKNRVKIVFSKGLIQSYSDGETVITDSDGNTYSTDHLIIAVGSKVFLPPIDGLITALESSFAVTTDNLFNIEENFSSIAIIGGGVIGAELASCFAMANIKVALIESTDRLGASADPDCMNAFEKSLKKVGVSVYKNSKVEKIEDKALYISAEEGVICEQVDKILVCTGRRPWLDGYGLEKLNVKTERGLIVTDDKLKTSVKGVYAVGDINGKSMLAHTAYREAEVCINNIIGEDDYIDYNLIPSVVYGNIEVGCVGENEYSENAASGWSVRKLPMNYSGRAVAEDSAEFGFCKLVFDENERLRGGFITGAYASEIILALTVMVQSGYTIRQMKKTIYAHPTVGEIIRETLYSKPEIL